MKTHAQGFGVAAAALIALGACSEKSAGGNGTEQPKAQTPKAAKAAGTKTIAALVQGREVIDQRVVPTLRDQGPDAWLDAIAAEIDGWRGQFSHAGIAVTGFVEDGCWSAMNPVTRFT